MAKRKNAGTTVARVLDRKNKAKNATTTTVELRGRFKAAHAKGMNALKRHDYDALDSAISEEAQIIEAQSELLKSHREDAAALSLRITANLNTSKKATKTRKRFLK